MDDERSALPEYVVDAHALWWFMKSQDRLSPAALAVFQSASSRNALLVVPAIVAAEVYFLSVKLSDPLRPSDLLGAIETSDSMRLSDLGRTQLELLDRLPEIPEMHDRLIAAEAAALGSPVVTRDPDIAASPQVESVW